MTEPAVNMEQITTLFEERQRYESWLSTLDEKRAATPAHIYERVRADYATRLGHVMEQLASHRAGLEEMERGFMDRLTSLDIDDAKNRDEAAEAELRAMVGELSAEHHEEVRTRTSAALASVAEERSRVAEELGRLRSVLEATVAAPAAAAGVPDAAAPAAQAPSQAAPRRATTPASAAPATSPNTDDWQLSFERTPAPPAGQVPARVSTTPTAPADDTRVAASAVPNDGAPRPASGGPFDDLEFLKTMIDPRTSGEGVAVGSGAPASASANSRGTPVSSNTPISSPRNTGSSSMPAVGRAVEEQSLPREGGADQVKTLKCQECGTLNYPTEWYCERCGAELAAL